MGETKSLKTPFWRPFIKNIGWEVTEAYFPSFCVNCLAGLDIDDKYLCKNCQNQIEIVGTRTCIRCGKITKLGQYCSGCRPDMRLRGIIYLSSYDGPVKELIHWFKYDKMLGIGQVLFEIIINNLPESLFDKFDLITSVPLHWEKKLERGFNQSEIIAKKLSKRAGKPYAEMLKRVKDTKSQMKLKRSQRLTNLEGAFCLGKNMEIIGKNILIIDDVATTGATLEECGKVLKAAGAREVWGLVVAHGK